MKRVQLYIVLALVILLVSIFLLTVRNDCLFNEERHNDACEIQKRDSLDRWQLNRLSDQLNEVALLVDSISCAQKDNYDTEVRNTDSIKKSLNQLERTGQRIINLMK